MKTKEEIINETIAAYWDSSKRSVGPGGCCYKDYNTGNTCALGRCMTDESIKLVLETGNNTGTGVQDLELLLRKVDNMLKEEYKGHEPDFWEEIQSFHDDVINFMKNDVPGLSDRGIQSIRNICQMFNLDFEQINFKPGLES